MIPKVNLRGSSFKGVTLYLMHDKDAASSDRVEWTRTGNLPTSNIERAADYMVRTVRRAQDLKRFCGGSLAGRKSGGKPVYHSSLSWALGEEPSQEHMEYTARDFLKSQGVCDHEYYMVAHNDSDHAHVHIVVNLVNPETGKIKNFERNYALAQKWALEYEREHGVHCQRREINASNRDKGKSVKYQDTKQDYSTLVTRAYETSDSGASFVHALAEHGLHLGRARRGNSFVIVDEHGYIQKLARQLCIAEKGKAKSIAIFKKIGALDVRDGDALAAEHRVIECAEIEEEGALEEHDSHIFAYEDHLKRLDDFISASHEKRQAVIADLDEEYGQQLERLAEDQALCKALVTATGLRGFWNNVSGVTRFARDRLVEIKRHQEECMQKRIEAMRYFERQQDDQFRALRLSQIKIMGMQGHLRSSGSSQFYNKASLEHA